MFRCRAGIAAGLIAAFLALPCAADRCVLVCAEARIGIANVANAAGEPGAAPACHHSSPAGPTVSHAPNRCSQDHDGTPGISAATAPADRLVSAAPTVASPVASSPSLSNGEVRRSGTAPPSRQSSTTARSASLRI